MNWTDERVEMLRKLWSEGLSASQIAAQLGGVSRNAVIGKVHRLKLSGRGRTAATPARPKKPAQATVTVKAPARPVAPARPATPAIEGAAALQAQFTTELVIREQSERRPDNIVPLSRNLALIDLNERTCKWPIGDPLSDRFAFCGNESGDAGPYCRYHARIAFQPASDRRRTR